MNKKNPLGLTRSQRHWTRKLCAALESEKYKQTRGQLKKCNSFCCLGVACDISKESKWEGTKYLGKGAYAPKKIQQKFGFPNSHGFFLDINKFVGQMDEQNDNRKRRFRTIAKAIRKQILGE